MGLNEAQKRERSEYLEKYLKISECSQKKPYVFISYASDNWETVFKTAVVPMQRSYGLAVYADKAFDKVNDRWIVPMLRNIRGADVIVAFVSQSYIESYACFLELLTAVNNKKPIVFVSLEDRLHLGDTTDQPEVERGVKNEILNQGANIATNTNNTSNDTMRAMKSAYTSISTLLEQDALSKYDISDAFINFFRDASVNRKTINDLNAVRGTIRSVSERVFDESLIAAPQSEPKKAEVVSQPAPEETEVTPQPAPEETRAVPQPAPQPVPQPVLKEDVFSWEEEAAAEDRSGGRKGRSDQTGKQGKKKKKWLIPSAAAVLLLFIIIFVSGGTKTVQDKPYTEGDGTTGIYNGEWRGGKPEGEGVLTTDQGVIFSGTWKDGVLSGQVLVDFPNGDHYEGGWLNGTYDQKGKLTLANGQIFEGTFEDGYFTEDGTLTYSNGDVYMGFCQFASDGVTIVPAGNGKLVYINGNVYTGDCGIFSDGINAGPNGQGTMVYADGSEYEGAWVDGSYEGHGTITYTDGAIFEGEFTYGQKNGTGFYTSANGTASVEIWENGYFVKSDAMGPRESHGDSVYED